MDWKDYTVVKRPFPGMAMSFGLIILYMALQIVVGVVAVIPVILHHAGPNQAAIMALSQHPQQLMKFPDFIEALYVSLVVPAFIMLAVLWLQLRREGRAAQIGLCAKPALPLVQTLSLGFCILAFIIVFESIYGHFILHDKEAQQSTHDLVMGLPHQWYYAVFIFIVVAGMGPLVEESLFRGYLQNALLQQMHPAAALPITAMIFAMIHMQPLAMPALFVAGLGLGVFYYFTKSLAMSVAMHAFINGMAVVATLNGWGG